MKVGDLVKVGECPTYPYVAAGELCDCFLCSQNSSRIGILTEKLCDDTTGAVGWVAELDVGEWSFWQPDIEGGDVGVISESR